MLYAQSSLLLSSLLSGIITRKKMLLQTWRQGILFLICPQDSINITLLGTLNFYLLFKFNTYEKSDSINITLDSTNITDDGTYIIFDNTN